MHVFMAMFPQVLVGPNPVGRDLIYSSSFPLAHFHLIKIRFRVLNFFMSLFFLPGLGLSGVCLAAFVDRCLWEQGGEGETDEGEEVKDPLDLSVWAIDVQL